LRWRSDSWLALPWLVTSVGARRAPASIVDGGPLLVALVAEVGEAGRDGGVDRHGVAFSLASTIDSKNAVIVLIRPSLAVSIQARHASAPGPTIVSLNGPTS
jgi:hypothetical protein